MTPCDNCIHFPICNIREGYRQLLVDTEPFKTKNPAFDFMVNCKHFRINYEKTTTTRGKEVMNTL